MAQRGSKFAGLRRHVAVVLLAPPSILVVASGLYVAVWAPGAIHQLEVSVLPLDEDISAVSDRAHHKFRVNRGHVTAGPRRPPRPP